MSDSREATIKTIAEIVNHLINAYEKNQPINLTKIKSQISKKYFRLALLCKT